MIIWGFRTRRKTLSHGHFHCPNEGVDRDCRVVEARRWFTLFFIPLIPLKVLGEFVECASCGATYDPRVLDMPTTAAMEDQLTRALRHVVVAMLHADERVGPEERLAAVDVVSGFGLAGYGEAALIDDLEHLQVDDLEHELASVAGMLSPQGQESVVRACLRLAAADGRIDDREVETVIRAGRSMGMPPAHIRGILQEMSEPRPETPT